MARPIRVFDGSFGRLQLVEFAAGEAPPPGPAPQIFVKQDGADLDFHLEDHHHRLTRDSLLFLNPGVASAVLPGTASAQLLSFQASIDWLRAGFPAVFDAGNRPFGAASE